VAASMVEGFLGLDEGDGSAEQGFVEADRRAARKQAARIAEEITSQPPISGDAVATIRARVSLRQAAVGYDGDYAGWIAKHS